MITFPQVSSHANGSRDLCPRHWPRSVVSIDLRTSGSSALFLVTKRHTGTKSADQLKTLKQKEKQSQLRHAPVGAFDQNHDKL